MLKRSISESWSFLWPNFIRLALIQIPLYLLMIIAFAGLALTLVQGDITSEYTWTNPDNILVFAIILLIVFPISFWVYSSTMVYIHHTSVTGEKLGILATWKIGLQKLLPLAWVTLTLSLIYIGLGFITGILYAIHEYLAILGGLAFLFVSMRLFPAIYVKVVDNIPSFTAIKITWQRTQGRFWSIFLGLIIVMLIMFALHVGFILIQMIPSLLSGTSGFGMVMAVIAVILSIAVNIISTLLYNLIYIYQYRVFIHTQPPMDDDEEHTTEAEDATESTETENTVLAEETTASEPTENKSN